ncbi:MAG: hypothetical protein M0P01_15410 [Treponema sp.]|nr:hypothetical protein [Treponema sp.]
MGKENGTFIRVGATSRPADAVTLRELEIIGSRLSYDGLQSRSLLGNDGQYNDEITQKLCNDIHRFMEKDGTPCPAVTKETLESFGVLKRVNDDFVPTNAYGILTNSFLTEYDCSIVRCACFKGTDKAVFLDKRDCEGPIYDQIDQAFQFILKHINLGMKIEGILGLDHYELPPEALREAVINAIVHRNYMFYEHVQIAVYDDRVEIVSPGSLPHGITLEQALNGTSCPRNPVIAKVFQRMNIMEEWGSGLRRIQIGCREYKVDQPEFIVSNIDFKIIFRRNSKKSAGIDTLDDTLEPENDTLDDTLEDQFIQILKDIPTADQTIVAGKLGVSVSTVKRLSKTLREKGILVRTGGKRFGKWRIAEKDK